MFSQFRPMSPQKRWDAPIRKCPRKEAPANGAELAGPLQVFTRKGAINNLCKLRVQKQALPVMTTHKAVCIHNSGFKFQVPQPTRKRLICALWLRSQALRLQIGPDRGRTEAGQGPYRCRIRGRIWGWIRGQIWGPDMVSDMGLDMGPDMGPDMGRI